MDGPTPYTDAVYICFGEAQGEMESPPGSGNMVLMDTHGAGAQRNDPKETGGQTYPQYFGPQGDVLYVNNYVRAVRDIGATSIKDGLDINFNIYPNPAKGEIMVSSDNEMETITIFNLVGVTVFEKLVTQNKTTINTAALSNGVYFMRISLNNGMSTVRKFIVEK